MEEILYKELSYKVQGTIMAVHRKYGPGLPERFYHKMLAEELGLAGLNFKIKPRLYLYSAVTGEPITYIEPDLLVEDKIIIELKFLKFLPKHFETQLYEYLKSSIYEIAYLVNFGSFKLDMRRRIFTNDRKSFYAKFNNQIKSNQ